MEQFLAFVKSCRVVWDNPFHFTRIDIVEFFNALAGKGITGVTRARKLAAVRSFFTVLKENTILASNPAETVKRAKKEEKDLVLRKSIWLRRGHPDYFFSVTNVFETSRRGVMRMAGRFLQLIVRHPCPVLALVIQR